MHATEIAKFETTRIKKIVTMEIVHKIFPNNELITLEVFLKYIKFEQM